MISTCRCATRVTANQKRFVIAASMVLLAVFSHAATTAAVESSPVLVVPAGAVALHVAPALNPAVKPDAAGRWQLVEVDRPEVLIPVQLIPAVTADGQDRL